MQMRSSLCATAIPVFPIRRIKKYGKGHIRLDTTLFQKEVFMGGGWAIQIISADRKGLLEPNTPETCIEYGMLHPGTKVAEDAQPLELNMPYKVHISVRSRPGGPVYERKFEYDFCVSRNEKGEKILVNSDWDDEAGGRKCLKPGESPKRGFWERLFGE
ncbi:MAG: hypothetical protein ACYDGO_08970 [Smithellaceae bacterium]